MAEIRTYRDKRDLIDIIADLERRLGLVESARSLGNASVDGGELTIRGGSLVMRNTNNKKVLELEPGFLPVLRFLPANGSFDEYQLSMFGWESDTSGAAVQLCVQQNDGAQDGGKLLLMRDRVYLSKQPQDPSGVEAYFSIGEFQDEGLRFRGMFWDLGQNDSKDGLIVGKVDIAAGFGAYAHTFSVPFADTPIIVYSLTSTSGAVAHSITAQSGSGFTVAWATGTTAKTVHFACFRRV